MEEGERSEPSELFRFLPTDVVVSKVIAEGCQFWYIQASVLSTTFDHKSGTTIFNPLHIIAEQFILVTSVSLSTIKAKKNYSLKS